MQFVDCHDVQFNWISQHGTKLRMNYHDDKDVWVVFNDAEKSFFILDDEQAQAIMMCNEVTLSEKPEEQIVCVKSRD